MYNMRKFLLLAFSVFCFPFLMQAQPDTLMQQILARPSMSTFISNGRQMFLEELLAGRAEKAGEVRNYLCYKTQGSNYLPFLGSEYFMTLYWTADYDELIINAMVADSVLNRSSSRSTVLPPRDELYQVLPGYTADSVQTLQGMLDAAPLDPMERDYLKLLLRWLVANRYDYTAMREIYRSGEAYLAEYPYTPYRDFVTKYLVFRIEESDWGGGMGLGLGVSVPGGDLPSLCKVGGAVILTFDAMYRRAYMGLGLKYNGGSLKKDLVYDGYHFAEGDDWGEVGLDARLGYALVNSNRIMLVPYAYGGLGWMRFQWSEKGNSDNRITRNSGAKGAYGAGVFCDIKFNDGSYTYRITGRRTSYVSLRLRYNVGFANYNIPGVSNSIIHAITAEGALFARQYR